MVDKTQEDQWNEEAKYLDDDDDDILNQDPSKLSNFNEEEDNDDEQDDNADSTAATTREEDDDGDDVDDESDDDAESDDGEDSDGDDDEDAGDDGEPEGEEDSGEGDKSSRSEEQQKDYMMPKSRYDSVKARLDKALDELDQLKQSSSSTNKTTADAGDLMKQLDQISAEFNEALSTGDVEKANELRAKERQLTEQVFDLKARHIATQEVENLRYQDFVTDIESKYPELNEDDPNFSKDLSREVVDLLTAFEKTGYRPADALKRAVSYVFPDGPTNVANAGEDTPEAPDAKIAERKEKSRKRNAKLQGKQPPKTKGKGRDSDKGGPRKPLSLAELDDEEFDKYDLDSEEMRAARGDYL